MTTKFTEIECPRSEYHPCTSKCIHSLPYGLQNRCPTQCADIFEMRRSAPLQWALNGACEHAITIILFIACTCHTSFVITKDILSRCLIRTTFPGGSMCPRTYLGGQEELGEPPHIKYKHFIILVMIFETGGITVRLLIAV